MSSILASEASYIFQKGSSDKFGAVVVESATLPDGDVVWVWSWWGVRGASVGFVVLCGLALFGVVVVAAGGAAAGVCKLGVDGAVAVCAGAGVRWAR